jgi:hypothetical protein
LPESVTAVGWGVSETNVPIDVITNLGWSVYYVVLQARSKYEKAFREAEKAQEVYKKAEADVHMTKADIEKVLLLLLLLLLLILCDHKCLLPM